MNRMLLWGAALALPLAALGYSWATTHAAAQLGEEWLIPIKGYDPQDLLRGHFIQYRYDWPIVRAEEDQNRVNDLSFSQNEFAYVKAICLEGVAPNIARAYVGEEPGLPFANVEKVMKEVAAPHSKCGIVARATLGNRAEVRGLDTGILYVSEEKAAEYQKRLTDPKIQGLIRVKIRPDGVIRPLAMEFRPRPKEDTPKSR